MSRRFGRNQRRRAREEASSLRAALALNQVVLEHSREQRQDLEDQISYAKSVLPFGSIALEPPAFKFAGEPGDHVVLAQDLPRSPARIDQLPPMAFQLSQPLDVLLTDVVMDRMVDKMHVRVQFASGHIGYAITRSALRELPTAVLVKRIAKELARALVADLQVRQVIR